MPGSDSRPLPDADVRHVLNHTTRIWDELHGARIFVTGGTGFFGRWMVESFLRANDAHALRAEIGLLTRDPNRFVEAAPHVAAHESVRLHQGDVRTFEVPSGPYSHVLHMATEAGPDLTPEASFQTAVAGTARVLAFASERGATKFLLTSSGAVYGPQPPDCERLDEEFAGEPDPADASAGYANGKRAAERMCAAAADEDGLEIKIARCFAFVGPLLPLDKNFAIGNFIRDALDGREIRISGDGTARRSYLYAADLAVWLWAILIKGESSRPYNVGSELDLSILELAQLVARVLHPGIPVRVAGHAANGVAPQRYVPSTARAARELDLHDRVRLEDAIARTARWYS